MGRVSQLSIVVAHLFTHAGRGFLSLVILQSHGGGESMFIELKYVKTNLYAREND